MVHAIHTVPISVAIVGSGFSGIGLAIRLKQDGIEDFAVLERGDGVGGTWHFNTYPGCACDVPSHLYSFSFAPNPGWSRTYSRQPEIRDYLERVVDDFGVRDEDPARLRGRRGALARRDVGARDLAGPGAGEGARSATGPLVEPKTPGFPGWRRSRDRRSTRPAGTTTWTCAASAWRPSGPARRRSSSCRRSRPTSRGCTSSSARRRG